MSVRSLSLKIDVCTYEGLHHGVPPLLDLLARHDVRATFFLTFGPDNSGKALLNVFKPGFLRKMLRTGAPSTYGLRTMVSGTLLPARVVAAAAPDLVRRIAAQGHEVAIHGWDHRRWQDQVTHLDVDSARDELRRARDACADALGRLPAGTGAPAWIVTPRSLEAQDELGFTYASDLRGGDPCRLQVAGEELRTPQIPTTGPCIEELLSTGVSGEAELAAALVGGIAAVHHAVFAVHAEFEGRAYLDFFDELLPRLHADRGAVLPLQDLMASLPRDDLPLRALSWGPLRGRSGVVAFAVPLFEES